MKYTFLSSDFSPSSNLSTVEITCRYGNFKGKAKFNINDDEKYKSIYVGCEIAEIRALIKAIKYQIKEINKEIKLLNNILNTILKSNKITNKNSIEIKLFRKQIKGKEKTKKYYLKQIQLNEEKIKSLAEYRIKQVDKILGNKN